MIRHTAYAGLVILICVVPVLAGGQQIYKCADGAGKVEFTDIAKPGCKPLDLPGYTDARPDLVRPDTVRIRRSRDGHFRIGGTVGTVPVHFVVDTGATLVAIAGQVALAAKLPPGSPVTISTANGKQVGYVLDGVSIAIGSLGPIKTTAVAGLVGMPADVALLGQSFLRFFDMRVVGDEMVLTRRR